ncbi:hypothetical protein GMOD_00005907 [Pyrenophora seminiperda CCB06]|uniref:Uncharacterized protein n=1 Tax=Pyrenophora seminiperda CCB06 TaxID=1302712 RepID=A0A3M7MAG8_9PLEO|nr:hypothetical protein GMOD_00005907 [Pyrenophora seminiperda CCB06]
MESIFTKTTQQSSRSRCKIPFKSMVDLSLVDRGVKIVELDADQFPDYIRELWYKVEDIQDCKRMISVEIKDEFIKLRPRTDDRC